MSESEGSTRPSWRACQAAQAATSGGLPWCDCWLAAPAGSGIPGGREVSHSGPGWAGAHAAQHGQQAQRAARAALPQVVAPYDAEDARGLLKAAIRDPDPVSCAGWRYAVHPLGAAGVAAARSL